MLYAPGIFIRNIPKAIASNKFGSNFFEMARKSKRPATAIITKLSNVSVLKPAKPVLSHKFCKDSNIFASLPPSANEKLNITTS